MKLGRIIGLDVGNVRIGVAVSDPMGIIAQPLEVITRKNFAVDMEALKKILEKTEAIAIVVGIPLNQNGEPGPQAEKTMAFVEKMKEYVSLEVFFVDERFSTAAAQRMLIQADVRRGDRKKVVDKIAAHHILQSYLDQVKRTG